jgi:hypothetical protein
MTSVQVVVWPRQAGKRSAFDLWVEAEIVRQTAIDRYHDTPGQIASRVRDLAAVPWREYVRV